MSELCTLNSNCFLRKKVFLWTLFLFVVNFNMCFSTNIEMDMLSTELDVIPLLSDICSENSMPTQSIDNDANRTIDPEKMHDNKNETDVLNDLSPSKLNQTLLKTSRVLLDELLLCIDHFSVPDKNNTSLENSDTDKRHQQMNIPEVKQAQDVTTYEEETNHEYFDQTEGIMSDPQWLTMLKEFDLLAEVEKNKSTLLGDELSINYTDPSTLGNNTFLKSAMTLYDTFINHYNMTPIQIHHNNTFHNFDNMDENDNGILFHQKSLLSTSNR